MNRFVGLSLVCLVCTPVQADSDQREFSGNSWSLRMSQDNDGPVNVKWEGKEYDKTGVVWHRKSQGVIVDGEYKPIKEKDFKNPSKRSFSTTENNDKELSINQKKFLEQQHKIKRPKGECGSFTKSFSKHHQNDQKTENDLWEVLLFPFVKNQHEKVKHKDFSRKNSNMHYSKVSDPSTTKDNLSRRSRISFCNPIEKIFEKIFGSKKDNDRKWNPKFKARRPLPISDHCRNSQMPKPKRHHLVEKINNRRSNTEFDNFEHQYQMMWKQMRELEQFFFDDFD